MTHFVCEGEAVITCSGEGRTSGRFISSLICLRLCSSISNSGEGLMGEVGSLWGRGRLFTP